MTRNLPDEEASATVNVPERPSGADRIFVLLQTTVAGIAAALAVWLLGSLMTVVFAAVLIAVILHGLAALVTRVAKLPHWAALISVVGTMMASSTGVAVLAGPGLGDQADKLRLALGGQAGRLHEDLLRSVWGRMLLEQVPVSVGGGGHGGFGVPDGLAGSIAGFLGTAAGGFASIVVVLIAAVYLAASPDTYIDGALRLVPSRHRPAAVELSHTAGAALWAWSAGQALAMLLVGVLSGVGLWIIGVPLAMVLGVLAGLTNFVPYLGAIAGAVPAIVIAFAAGPRQGLETIALYLVIQAIEGNLIEPLIQKRAVDLPPALTILSQTAFGIMLGIPGLMFATPHNRGAAGHSEQGDDTAGRGRHGGEDALRRLRPISAPPARQWFRAQRSAVLRPS